MNYNSLQGFYPTKCPLALRMLFSHNKTPKVFCLTFGVHVTSGRLFSFTALFCQFHCILLFGSKGSSDCFKVFSPKGNPYQPAFQASLLHILLDCPTLQPLGNPSHYTPHYLLRPFLMDCPLVSLQVRPGESTYQTYIFQPIRRAISWARGISSDGTSIVSCLFRP